MGLFQNKFYVLIRERYPMMSRGIAEARAIAPELVDHQFEQWTLSTPQDHLLFLNA